MDNTRNPQVTTNFLAQKIVNFTMTRDSGELIVFYVSKNGMICSLAIKVARMFFQIIY